MKPPTTMDRQTTLMDPRLYEKQLRWKRAASAKVDRIACNHSLTFSHELKHVKFRQRNLKKNYKLPIHFKILLHQPFIHPVIDRLQKYIKLSHILN